MTIHKNKPNNAQHAVIKRPKVIIMCYPTYKSERVNKHVNNGM